MSVSSRRLSHIAALSLGVSPRVIAAALLIGAPAAAWAQDAGQPTANPTAKVQEQSTNASDAPTPTAEAVAQSTPPAAAEDEGPSEGEVTVTGIRGSLASSARIKKSAALIVDSVSAEDIGKLPDVSIADSLARLPGVTAQRLEGRDQRLSIRGLGPDFSTTLLNGREQVTVGDNRGVEYDQYPSEFFKNVNVYKSSDASLIAAGVSGTVDLRMLRPLSQPGRTVVVSGRGQMNSQKKLNPDGDRYGYRASGTYVDKFADDTFGVAIGVSATSAPSQNERYNAWGFPVASQAGNNMILGGAKSYVQSNKLDRYGAVATLEWQPSENFHSTFDALYSHFREVQRLRGIEFPINPDWSGTPTGTTTVSNVTASNGLVTGATIGNVQAVQRNDYNKRTADNYSFGWNNDIAISDRLRLNVDASWSHAKRTDFLLETYSGAGYNGTGVKDTVRISQNGNGTYSIVPTLDYTNTNIIRITDPRGWGYNGTTAVVQAGFLNKPKFSDDLKSLRANLTGDFVNSVLKNWEIGANYSRRKKVSAYTSFFLCPKGGGTNCTVSSGTPTSVAVPTEALLGKNVALDYLGVPQMLTLDPLYLYNNTLTGVYDNRPGSLVRDNNVIEDVYTGYAKLNIDGVVGSKPLKGSIGFQVVQTKQSSTGTISSFANGVVTVVPATGSDKYFRFLPSATMSVELDHNFFVKLGAARTMVRPRLDQERINQEFSVDTSKVGAGSLPQNSPFSSRGGNIELKPYQSTNIDISIEKYFSGGGYVSVAAYGKHLTDFVDPNRNFLYDFSAALGQLSPAQQAIVLSQNAQFGLVSGPDNSGRGDILGAEATLDLPFKNLTTALDGFGVFGSASYNYSSIKYEALPEAITLPGLSKYVWSATGYFEKAGFQARLSYRYRSKFLAEIAGLSANPEYRQGKAEGILDAQIGYEFQDGPLRGLAILAQAKNITDRPFVTYEAGDQRLVRDHQRYGRDYYLGVTYKF